jgi:hypothetical protein
MNYIKKISAYLLVFTLLSFSCTEDIMDRINSNPNNPTDMQARLIITDVINRTAHTLTGADYAFYASIYVEYNVGIFGQMYGAEIRSAEPTSATTYNNNWGSVYRNLSNLKTIIEKCSPGGNEEDNVTVLGIAQVLTAYNLAMLTDLSGDVPWTEALQPGVIWAPKLDKQEALYQEVNKLLDDAIVNLNTESTIAAIGSQDPIYAGRRADWIRFANGLKARYAMRLSHRAPNYDAVLAAAALSFSDVDQEARFVCSAAGIRNPFEQFRVQRDDLGASQSLFDKLDGRNDPRSIAFFRAHPSVSALEFAPNGTPAQTRGRYGISAMASSRANNPIYLMSYHELEFLKAEAHARKGDIDDAKTHLEIALTHAFINAELTAADAKTYFDNEVEPQMTNQMAAIREVMIQKYFGLFEIEAIETYNDIRRLRAMGETDFIPLANTGRFPLRFSYGNSDVTTNSEVRAAYGDGTYVYTENVWWAGGSR